MMNLLRAFHWEESGYTGLTEGVRAEFHLFSAQHFIIPGRLGFMFARQPPRMRNVLARGAEDPILAGML
jgi:hypothetical protein